MQHQPDPLEILGLFRKISYHVGNNILMKRRPGINKTNDVDMKSSEGKVDWVTPADKASQKYIFSEISKFDETSSRIGEEDDRIIINPNRFYIADPLDGTGIFSGKIKDAIEKPEAIEDFDKLKISIQKSDFQRYTVFLSYVENNKSIVEVVYAPELNESIFAVEDMGAFYQKGNSEFIPLKVNDNKDVSDSVAAIALLKPLYTPDFKETFNPFMQSMHDFEIQKEFGFTSAIYESVATGFPKGLTKGRQADAYINTQQYVWDCPFRIIKEMNGSSIMVYEKNGTLVIDEFSHKNFNIADGNDNKTYKQPYAIANGSPRVVDKFVETLQERL